MQLVLYDDGVRDVSYDDGVRDVSSAFLTLARRVCRRNSIACQHWVSEQCAKKQTITDRYFKWPT